MFEIFSIKLVLGLGLEKKIVLFKFLFEIVLYKMHVKPCAYTCTCYYWSPNLTILINLHSGIIDEF